MKVLVVHAHFDDFEFTSAGTFELWRRKSGKDFRGRVLVCTNGEAGHHFRTREETGRLRLAEQEASAKIGGYEFELLRLPNGETIREGIPSLTVDFMAALWRSIREFEPEYLLCPPLAADPFSGIHNDHVNVAEAVRRVAYLLNVPHAFTPEIPTDEIVSRHFRTPVILTLYDSYMCGANSYDFAIDVGEAWDALVAMTWCHRTQVAEWLPWSGRHYITLPMSEGEWSESLRRRFERRNRALGINLSLPVETFQVTGWGTVPALDQILADFPPILPGLTEQDALRTRLSLWNPL